VKENEHEKNRCKMKPKMIIGIILIVLGVAALVFQCVTYTTRQKDLDDLGNLHAAVEKQKGVQPIPGILGGLALGGGVVLVMRAARKARAAKDECQHPGS
jgi:uncharacterized membrane protein